MFINKTKYSSTKQRGFFTVGVGLTLLALYSTITAGIVTSQNSGPTDAEKLAMQTQVELPSSANH